MKKYLFIIVSAILVLGAGCVNKSTMAETATFSDPKANFTFEYPSHWVLNPDPSKSENVENKIYVTLGSDEISDPCPGLDGNGQEVHPIVKSYMLNDKKGPATVQMCGQVAAISWDLVPASTSASGRITARSLNHIGVRLNELNDDFSTTTQEFIDQIERIVKSIRIK